ncbi:MAG: chromosomal replication initiator protein DnaA [Clostridiales bacterium]|nr:chromosomal replication initiator protein DnaA [Clostridiales bacterium]
MISAQIVWSKALPVLEAEMTPISYKTWIKDIKPISIEGSTLILMAQSELYLTSLRQFYASTITDCVNRANGSNYSVNFIIKEEAEAVVSVPVSNSTEKGLFFGVQPKYTFDTFVTGESNRFAHAAAVAVADNPASAYNPLYIYGGSGLGKTHLLHAIGNYVHELRPEFNICCVSSEEFTNDVIAAIKYDTREELRKKYRSLDLLLVDDIQFIGGKEATELEFFNTFNALYGANKQIVITSDQSPKDLPSLQERLKSRFVWGITADIKPPEVETRVAILKSKAERDGIDISGDALLYMAEQFSANVRELESCYNRVMLYAEFSKRAMIDRSFVEAILKDYVSSEGKHMVTPELIKRVTADYFEISVEELTSTRRDKRIATPRQIAMYLCRTLTNTSYPDIGKAFGGKHYSTVMYSCDQITSELAERADISTAVDDITNRLTNDLSLT